MTDRQNMVTWTAHKIIERIKSGDVKNESDIDQRIEELFSEMAHNNHKWAEKIKQYSWKHFLGSVKNKIKELAKYE